MDTDSDWTSRRLLPLQGGINFRDIGGYRSADGRKVRWGKVYRSGHLNRLTDTDRVKLADLNLTQVHDFRRVEEQRRTPSQIVDVEIHADYELFIGSIDQFWELLHAGEMSAARAHELVVSGYADCVDEVAPGYHQMFLRLQENAEAASLIHCAAGKDRTGLAAALILLALDVAEPDVIGDYMLTIRYLDTSELQSLIERRLREAQVSRWETTWLQPYCSVHQDNIEAFFNAVRRKYRDVGTYLREAIGLDEYFLREFRDVFLEA